MYTLETSDGSKIPGLAGCTVASAVSADRQQSANQSADVSIWDEQGRRLDWTCPPGNWQGDTTLWVPTGETDEDGDTVLRSVDLGWLMADEALTHIGIDSADED